MSKIKVNRIEASTLPHYNSDDEYIGHLNEFESLDLRCQLVEQQVTGYYIIANLGKDNETKIDINSMGEIDYNKIPQPTYMEIQVLYARLITARKALINSSSTKS